MDELRKQTRKEYDSWDLKCPYIGSRRWKNKLKDMFRKISRKRLKQELNRIEE